MSLSQTIPHQVLSEETREEMRKQADGAMRCSLYEYCPSEFLMLLREYELLLMAVEQRLSNEAQDYIYDELAQARRREKPT